MAACSSSVHHSGPVYGSTLEILRGQETGMLAGQAEQFPEINVRDISV